MSSPAASSGVHRDPDPARERRCAELTAGAEREDAPSRTAHLTHRAVPAPSRTCSPHASAAPAAEPYAARHDPDGHEPIDGWRILLLQHDIVTGEAIVARNVVSGAASSSTPVSKTGRTEQDDLLGTQPPEVARTEPSALSGTRRHASGWPPSRAAHSGAPIQCRRARTRPRAFVEDPGRRAVRTHRATAPVGRQAVRHSGDRTEQHADQGPSPHRAGHPS